jgi:hypothetical protein
MAKGPTGEGLEDDLQNVLCYRALKETWFTFKQWDLDLWTALDLETKQETIIIYDLWLKLSS